MASWSFLTNHALVLTCLGRYPDSTGLAIAQAVGITERAARKIVADLLAEAYIEREKVGRRNRYRLNTALRLPHPMERTVTVGELLGLLCNDRDTQDVSDGGEDPGTQRHTDAPNGISGTQESEPPSTRRITPHGQEKHSHRRD